MGILRAGVATRNRAAVQNLTRDLMFYTGCHHEKIKIPRLMTKAEVGLTKAESLPFQPWSGGVEGPSCHCTVT